MRWRGGRIRDLQKNAWNWCENNGFTEFDKRRQEKVVDKATMNMVCDGYSTAKCVFYGTYKSRRRRNVQAKTN